MRWSRPPIWPLSPGSRTHTPPDARVAVSAVIFPWAPDYVVGVNAGYSLPLLANRAAPVLPMLYPGERGGDRESVAQMIAVAQRHADAPGVRLQPPTYCAPRESSYVYHSGRSPYPQRQPSPAIQPSALAYDQDGVRIWAVAGG